MKTTGVPLQNCEKVNRYEYNQDVGPSECVVSGALALVLRISRCAGVAPLRVHSDRTGWRITISPPLTIFQRILITFLNVTALAALILDISQAPDRRIRVGESAVAACVWIFDLVLVMLIASLVVYCGSARMENIIRIVNQLKQINIYLNTERCSKIEKIGVIAVAGMTTWTVVIQVVEVYTKTQNYIDKGFDWSIMVLYNVYYVANVQGLLALMLWACVVAEVRAAGSALNHLMPRLLHESEFTSDPLHTQSTIRRLAFAHEQISEVIKQMNNGNGAFIIAVLMSTFLHLVVTPYYLLLWLNSNETLLKIVIMHLFWSVLHITTLLITVEPCHWTQEQRETTKYLLSRLMVRLAPRTALLSRELDYFAKQTMLTDVKFTPLGILTLGRPYMAAMLGGVATYLVILLQFQSIADRHEVN